MAATVTYLDANASEPLRPEAREAVLRSLELTGNPASIHAAGRLARRSLEDARAGIAATFGAAPSGVVFTSGGTEANALAARLAEGRRILVGATEHDAVLQSCPAATRIPVHPDGQLRLDVLEALLSEGPALVCLMLANNETGVQHPLAAAAALCRRHGALLHVDAVQAAGRLEVHLDRLGAASLALSSHKLGGPKGAGALLLAPGPAPSPLIRGGGQERGRRGGTPALPAIAGFAAAGAAAERDRTGGARNRVREMRDAIEATAVALGAMRCGGDAPRLDNTTCLACPGLRAELQVIALDLAGVQVSAGAACSSGKVAHSHVLQAMGLGDLSGQAIRVSVPWNAPASAAASFAAAYAAMLATARRAACAA